MRILGSCFIAKARLGSRCCFLMYCLFNVHFSTNALFQWFFLSNGSNFVLMWHEKCWHERYTILPKITFFASGLYKLPQFHFHLVQLSGTCCRASISFFVFYGFFLVVFVLCIHDFRIFARNELIFGAWFSSSNGKMQICRFIITS